MIPDFKTYITESIWSDIQDRSMGKTVRKEDDIDLLDINELCEYLKTIYKTNSDNDISVIKIEDNMYLTICLYEDEYGYYRYIYYDGDYINTQLDVIETLKCLLEFERKFSIKFNENDFVVNCIDIYPKDKARIPVTNKFFIEVLDFILDRINTPLEQKIKKISNIKESIWSDIQDRSMGKTVRKEDDINLLNFDEFIEYLKKSYDVCIYDPHNFFEIGRFHIDDEHKRVISIPIEKNDNSETPNMGNRMLTITVNLEHGGEISITPNMYVFRLYPREIQKTFGDKYIINTSTHTLTPKDKIVNNSVIVDVIDKLLGMVENPILKKN